MLYFIGKYSRGRGRCADAANGMTHNAAAWLLCALTVWQLVCMMAERIMPDTVLGWYFEAGFAAAVAVAGIAVFVWKLFRYGVCDLAVLLALALAVWASVATLDAAARMQAL